MGPLAARLDDQPARATGRRPLGDAGAWSSPDAAAIASQAVALGIRSIIVLDLVRVGMAGGTGTEELCRRIVAEHPHVEVVAGGGIRGPDDLARLEAAGVHAALVASALHDGRIRGP